MRKSDFFKLLVLSCVTSYLLGLCWTVLPSLSPVFVREGLSVTTYGTLNLLLVLCAGLTTLAIYQFGGGRVTLRFFQQGLLLLFLSNSFILVADHYLIFLYPAVISLGIAIALILSGLGAVFPLLKQSLSPILLAAVFACVNFGSMSGPTFFRFWGHGANWQGLVIIYLITSLLMSAYAFWMTPFPLLSLPSQTRTVRQMMRSPVAIYASILFLYAFLDISISAYLQLYLTKERQIDIEHARGFLSLFWATVGGIQLAIAYVSRHIKPRNIYVLLSLFLLLGYIFLNIVAIPLEISIISLGVGCSAFIALTISLAEWEDPQAPRQVSAIIIFSYFLGAGCASQLFAFLIDWKGYPIVYKITLGVSLLISALIFSRRCFIGRGFCRSENELQKK